MAITTYDPDMTMREARAKYFEVNRFGANGGYDDAWVDFKFGPVPFPFPNTAPRVRAVRYHDLHHVLTAYDTDTIGEFEIAAWELGAGCKDFYAAWQLNLGGMVAGALVAPRRTFRAFLRGRRSRSLYGEELDPLLDGTVAAARARTGVDVERPEPTAADVALFAGGLAAGLVVGLALFALVLPIAPFAALALNLRRRAAA